jgi:ribosome-binding factor A
MATAIRQKRVAERIQHELAEMLQHDLKDPRLATVSVTRVLVDRELAHANIFVSSWEGSARRDDILAALEAAHGFIRREIGRRVKLRLTPHVVFHWDPGPEKVEEVGRLLDELKASGAPEPPQNDGADRD